MTPPEPSGSDGGDPLRPTAGYGAPAPRGGGFVARAGIPAQRARPASALPSIAARAFAFAAIVLAGGTGAAIGASFVTIECHGSCATPIGIGGVVGGAGGAGGVGVVAVLTLRAMGEWKRVSEEDISGPPTGPGPGDEPRAV